MFTNERKIPTKAAGMTATLGIRGLAALAMMALIPILVACNLAGANDLAGTSWRLHSLTGNPLLADTAITIEFSENVVSGTTGCNHYEGSYQVVDNSLFISDLFATEMACPEPAGVLEQEEDYLAALNVAASFQIAGDRLEILDEGGGQRLVFVQLELGFTTPLEESRENPDEPEQGIIQNTAPTPDLEPTSSLEVVDEPSLTTTGGGSAVEQVEDATEWTTLISDAFPVVLSYPINWQYVPDASNSLLNLPYVRGFSVPNETLVNQDGCAIHIGFGGSSGPTETITNDLVTIDGLQFTKRTWYEGEAPIFITFLPSGIIPNFEGAWAWVSQSNATGCIQSIDAIIGSIEFTAAAEES